MAKKETNSRNKKNSSKAPTKETSSSKKTHLLEGLSDQTRHSAIAILFFVLGIFFLVAQNYGGSAGAMFYSGFSYLLGVGYYALPLLLFILGISFFRESRPNLAATESVGAFLFLFSVLGLLDTEGGILGKFVAFIFSPFGP